MTHPASALAQPDMDVHERVASIEVTRHRRCRRRPHDRSRLLRPRSRATSITASRVPTVDVGLHRSWGRVSLRSRSAIAIMASMSARSMWGYIDDGVECPRGRRVSTPTCGWVSSRSMDTHIEPGVGVLAIDGTGSRRSSRRCPVEVAARPEWSRAGTAGSAGWPSLGRAVREELPASPSGMTTSMSLERDPALKR